MKVSRAFFFFSSLSVSLQVALHACGVATDMVVEHCIQAGAAFVISPCCYGFIQNAVKFTFPKRFVTTCRTSVQCQFSRCLPLKKSDLVVFLVDPCFCRYLSPLPFSSLSCSRSLSFSLFHQHIYTICTSSPLTV